MFKGFSLFNDVEDKELRQRNRAVVLANIAADNTKNKLISPKGASLVLGYFGLIPEEDRLDVKVRFAEEMKHRGYALQA